MLSVENSRSVVCANTCTITRPCSLAGLVCVPTLSAHAHTCRTDLLPAPHSVHIKNACTYAHFLYKKVFIKKIFT